MSFGLCRDSGVLWRSCRLDPPSRFETASENNLAVLDTGPVCSCEVKCAASSTGHLWWLLVLNAVESRLLYQILHSSATEAKMLLILLSILVSKECTLLNQFKFLHSFLPWNVFVFFLPEGLCVENLPPLIYYCWYSEHLSLLKKTWWCI